MPCYFVQFHQYQVVGRALPTAAEEHPKIYRMKLWATNEVRAKTKFWYFLRKLKKVKKSNGQVLGINEIFEKNPATIKNFGIWLRYQSRTGYHMYKDLQEVLRDGFSSQGPNYQDRHCPCQEGKHQQFHDSNINFPLMFPKVRPPSRKLNTTYLFV